MKNSSFVYPKIFTVSKDHFNLIMIHQTPGIFIKNLNFEQIHSIKKLAILIKLVFFLEFLQNSHIPYSIDNVFLNNNFEFRILLDQSDSHKNIMITESFYKKPPLCDYFYDFLFIFRKMFPLLAHSSLLDLATIRDNPFHEIRNVLLNLIWLLIGLDTRLLVNNEHDVSHEKDNHKALLIIREYLSQYIQFMNKGKTDLVNEIIRTSDLNFIKNKSKENHKISKEIEINLTKNIKELCLVKEINVHLKKKDRNLKKRSINLNLIREVLPDVEIKSYIYKNNIEESCLQKNYTNVIMTECNSNKEIESNNLKIIDLNSNISKKKKNKTNDLDVSEQSKLLKNDILPNISSVVYKNINFETEEMKDKKALKIINTKMYLDYKKNLFVEKKNNVQNIYHSLNKNSVIRSRLDSGKKNIRSILKDYSSFNKDYIARIFSPKDRYPQQFNFFDEKPGIILKKDFFKDNLLISKK